MASPLAAGLFQRGIVESGNCVTGGRGHGWGWALGTQAEGLEAGRGALASLNATSVEELRAMDARDLIASTTGYGQTETYHSPVFVDGHVLVEHPYETWRAGKVHGSSLIIGGNTADGLMEKPYGNFSASISQAAVNKVLEGTFLNVDVDRVKKQYFPEGGRFSRPDAGLVVSYRDGAVLCPSVLLATFATRANISTYMYGWGAPGAGAAFRNQFEFDHALPHGLELHAFAGDGDEPGLFTPATARSVVEYWTSFAKTGVPSDESQGIVWPLFEKSADGDSPMAPFIFLGEGVPAMNGDTANADLRMPTADDCAMWNSFIEDAFVQRTMIQSIV